MVEADEQTPVNEPGALLESLVYYQPFIRKTSSCLRVPGLLDLTSHLLIKDLEDWLSLGLKLLEVLDHIGHLVLQQSARGTSWSGMLVLERRSRACPLKRSVSS